MEGTLKNYLLTYFVIMEGGALPVPSIFTKNEKVASGDDVLDKRHLRKRQKSVCCGAGGGLCGRGQKLPSAPMGRGEMP